MINKISLIFLFFFLSACGYQSLVKESKDEIFFQEISFLGDSNLNFIIKSKNFKAENSWLMKKLLNSRLKHYARLVLNLNSFIRFKYISNKNDLKNLQKKKQYYSAGKSVHNVKNIESAITIMKRLGESWNIKKSKNGE